MQSPPTYNTPPVAVSRLPSQKAASSGPTALATFDFDAENDGELTFKEGDIINLLSRIDENWLEGEVRGKKGIFPSNYVEVQGTF